MLASAFLDLAMVTGRYSSGLADQCDRHWLNRTANIHSMIDAIGALERADKPSGMRAKPATRFERRLLRGLWHQHYFEAGFLAKNLAIHWKREALSALPRIAIPLDDKAAGILAHQLTIGGFQDRAAKGELTGEWIVFARDDMRAYYLTLAKHDEEDRAIWDRCKACGREFPELQILAEDR
jgi:hypothetical protein